MRIILLLMLTPFMLLSQTQIGQDIFGENINRQFGARTTISNDGARIAVHAIDDNNGTFNVGSIRVYDNLNGTWQQVGQTIFGDGAGDDFGRALEISGDGNFLVASSSANDNAGMDSGLVRVFQLVNNIWEQVGDDFTGNQDNGDGLGAWVSITDDGSIIATGNNFQVSVYQFLNGVWELRGTPIFNLSLPSFTAFGRTIELSSDGEFIAIGATENDDANFNVGQVQVFQFLNNDWLQIGGNVNGDASNASFGDTGTVALADDGATLIVGVPRKDNPDGVSVGGVNIYNFINGDWVLVEELFGDFLSDNFGRGLSINGDGNILAVSAPNGVGGDSYVRLFENEGAGWVQIGIDILDEGFQQFAPRTSALSGDGSFIVVGSPFTSGSNGETNLGVARIYDTTLDPLSVEDSNSFKSFQMYPNPAESILYVHTQDNLKIDSLVLLDQLGSIVVQQKNTNEINVSALAKGVYFVTLKINNQISTSKFIKN